ncbi:MAG: glycosyltransferase family 4 protein [Nitrospirota bacterium]
MINKLVDMGYQLSTKSSLRLCIVSPLFHPNLGGPGRQAYTMAAKLSEKGVCLIVLTRKLDLEIPKIEGVTISPIPTPAPGRYNLLQFTFLNLLISMIFSLGVLAKLIVYRNQYDIVQFYGASLPLLMNLLLIKFLGKKIVAKLSGARPGMEAGSFDGIIFKKLFSKIFSFVDAFIVMSGELRHKLGKEDISKEKIAAIPNGVNINLFYSYEKEKRRELKKYLELSSRMVFIYTGRLAEGKGLEILLGAMKDVLKEDKTAYLLLLGEGQVKNKLEDKAAAAGISDNICFKGNVNNVHEFLNSADVFVFPSLREGMPNSLLEAMSCGLPVIASKIGGVVDVVEDGKSGILFEPGDVSGLASAMIILLKDKELRQKLGAEARKRAVEDFSIDRVADEYIKLYQKLLTEN